MRKVTKILGKVLSAAVLLLIVLPLALSLLLSINAVQNFVVGRAAQFASRKLETVVRIDRVDIGISTGSRSKDFMSRITAAIRCSTSVNCMPSSPSSAFSATGSRCVTAG